MAQNSKTAKTRNVPFAKLSPSTNRLKGMDVSALESAFVDHLEFSLAKDRFSATERDCFKAAALTVRDRLIERWIATQQTYYREDAKRVYYISMEFLMGRTLGNALLNLGLYHNMYNALHELGFRLELLRDMEDDPALGNGGLGRLAACFLDSMATLELPAYGYGIRYEYGLFQQRFVNGEQVESPDNWLRYGNPWEIERPEYIYPVRFYGKVVEYKDDGGRNTFKWVDTEDVVAMAYDTPIPGFKNNTVNNLRLWSAKSSREFNLAYFNHGEYDRAVLEQIESETISKILYPNDHVLRGKELRLKQEYFMVSATLQDIVRRFKKIHKNNFQRFPDKVAVQLNDTHPALCIPELMRILLDEEKLTWEKAWEITKKTFAYTNHTILAEALERWSVPMLEYVLPRHMQLIYEINRRFLDSVIRLYPDDIERLRRVSLIEEGEEKRVRMANLAIVGSHSVNGVAALHTDILRQRVFHDFHAMYPKLLNNKTNGVTQRRWLMLANWELSDLLQQRIGDAWMKDLFKLQELGKHVDDEEFRKAWKSVKKVNKHHLAKYIKENFNVELNPDSMFDVQIKRLHEYKRQFLNLLHVVTLYNRLKKQPDLDVPARTVLFAGKAAPGYFTAKLIIRLINNVAEVINNDPQTSDKLKLLFLPNYSVTLAQKIIPAADLSEQISTAGMEASGTGNMKFALNGAVTIGTLDGANIEIKDAVGDENIFIFGLQADEVERRRREGHNPHHYLEKNEELRTVIDMIANGTFSHGDSDTFKPLIESLFNNDHYMILADFDAYIECQEKVNRAFKDVDHWTRMSILNTAYMGYFSSDRTIKQYAEEIWNVKPVSIKF